MPLRCWQAYLASSPKLKPDLLTLRVSERGALCFGLRPRLGAGLEQCFTLPTHK